MFNQDPSCVSIQTIIGKWLLGPEVAEIVKMSILEALVGFGAFSLHQSVLEEREKKKEKKAYTHTAANDSAPLMCVETNNSRSFAKRKQSCHANADTDVTPGGRKTLRFSSDSTRRGAVGLRLFPAAADQPVTLACSQLSRKKVGK